MKKNKDTFIFGDGIVLVPYRKHHVPKYHGWMQSSELQQLTASEPLTLQQEYEMQQSWLLDEDKCTFIILEAVQFLKSQQNMEDEVACMIGDVNIFFNDDTDKTTAELEIMIAEKDYRGKGLGKRALCMMMKYGMNDLSIRKFSAKIGYNNKSSQHLFEKLKFTETERSEVFQEITYNITINDEYREFINDLIPQYEIQSRPVL